MAALRNEAFLKTPKYQEQQKRAVIDGAHPAIVEFSRKLCKRLAGMGIPAFPHCIVRTEQEQLRLFNEGFSKDTPKDGVWPHMGYAVDIIHSKLAWMDGIPNAWAIFGHVGKEVAASMQIGVTWGGDWKLFKDPAHWELTHWKAMAAERRPAFPSIKL